MINIKNFTDFNSKELFFRFPLVFLFMFSCFILAIFEINEIFFLEKSFQGKLFLSSFSLIGFCLGIYLFFQRKQLDKIKKVLFFFVAFLTTYLGIFLYEDSVLYLIFAAFLTITFSNFLAVKSSNQSILSFNMKMNYSLAFAFFSSLILALGIKMIFLTLNYLFSITFFDKFIDEMMVFISIIVFPTLFLANIPKNIDPFIQTLELKKAVELLIKNILTPLILIYTVILYAYFIKIIILQELPQGDLSWIICTFLSLVILVKAFLKSISKQTVFTNIIDKYFVYIMILPIIFLDIAIYARVSEYGVTQLRYCLILLSIWFTFLIVLELVQKQFCIKSSLISMFLLLLVASITPLSSSNISLNSQFNRFKTFILQYESQELKKQFDLKELKLEKKVELTSIINYLSRSKKGMKLLNNYFNKEFKTKSEIFKFINMKESYSSFSNLRSKYIQGFELYNISYDSKGYTNVLPLMISEQDEKKEYIVNNSKLKAVLKDSVLNLELNNSSVSFDLKDIVNKWSKKGIKRIDSSNYKEAVFIKENNNISYKLNLQFLDINTKEQTFNVSYINAILMIKK